MGAARRPFFRSGGDPGLEPIAVPALIAALLVFLALFGAKSVTKIVGLFPTVKYQPRESIYYTRMMSTGLTFGTISALFISDIQRY